VRAGQLAPDGTNRFGSLVTFAAVPALNNAGKVVFAATLTGPGIGTTNDTGLFRAQSASGMATRLVRKGQLAPDGNGRFADFSSPAFNNSGQVAFYGTFTGTLAGKAHIYPINQPLS